MMTFYLGKEIKEYLRKFKELKVEFMSRAGDSSNSAIFRFIVDILYDDMLKRKEEREAKT